MKILTPTKYALLSFILLLTSCKETILHNLDEREANKVTLALAQVGIEANKRVSPTGWEVEVDRAKSTTALQTIEEHRLFKPLSDTQTRHSQSLMPSREERSHFFERQLASNLEYTLERLPNVLEAHVHLQISSAPRFSLASGQRIQSASVLLISKTDNAVDIAKVQKLISGATGSDDKSVVVLVTTAESYTGSATSSLALPQTPQAGGIKAIADNYYLLILAALLLVSAVGTVAFFHLKKTRRLAARESTNGAKSPLLREEEFFNSETAAAMLRPYSPSSNGHNTNNNITTGGF
ncbi:MAG: hypothetical protein IT291_06565 [Deltaproteobacteria bacterium]|nr:hypothetical protein [Deltaproteobacteria bacterium]